MILGLPVNTFLWVFGIQIVAIVISIIFGVTFKDTESWWMIDDLLESGKEDNDGKH